MRIERYTPDQRTRWNEFCRNARNATFLFDRGFMDYHANRFVDCSLMALNDKGKIVALLPADLTDNGSTLRSHGGLTYGGWIVPMRHFSAATMLDVFEASIQWMRANSIRKLIYKPLPYIYSRRPASDDLYALFRFGAVRTGCLISSTIDMANPGPFNESSRQDVKRCRALGLVFDKIGIDGVHEFWQMLESCLMERHDATPIHSLDEIRLLMSRFPDNIKIYGARTPDGELLAATMLFVTPEVAHTQYIATSPLGREMKAFPFLAEQLIGSYSGKVRYFDFGTSNNDPLGNSLNDGLLLQKSGLGASGVAHEVYCLEL